MANLSKATLTRVGRMLGGEDGAAPLAKLVSWSRIPRKTLYNWTLLADDPQYRTMSPMAKRLVVVLAYFAMCGQLTSQRLGDIESLEAALDDTQKFQKAARRVSRVLAGLDLAPEGDAETGKELHEDQGTDEGNEPLATAEPNPVARKNRPRKGKRLPGWRVDENDTADRAANS
jgi:hypothetical protein